MSQLERLTPEVPFPEAEGRPTSSQYMVYGTPWPLSEDDYLCVYDPKAKNHGIYWIDRVGNRELIYRDPAISCHEPDAAARAAHAAGDSRRRPRRRPRPRRPAATTRPATVAVMNVYDSDFAWPAGHEDRRPARHPGAAQDAPPRPTSRGSAWPSRPTPGPCWAPCRSKPTAAPTSRPRSGKAIYFQALDEQRHGRPVDAIGTYVHPGEQLTCQGCHERKHRAARPPSQDAAGPAPRRRRRSSPTSTARIRSTTCGSCSRCSTATASACHQREEGPRPDRHDRRASTAGPDPTTNLAGKYGFYFHVTNGSIKPASTAAAAPIAGQFGARAAKLLNYLGRAALRREALAPRTSTASRSGSTATREFFGTYENIDRPGPRRDRAADARLIVR